MGRGQYPQAKLSGRADSNHQPPGLQPGALPIEPLPVPRRAGCPKADRVAEVVGRCCADAEIVVNVQGDEPELEPDQIDLLVASLRNEPGLQMSTLACPIRDRRTLEDPSCVKVVTGTDGRALYFSRHPIPCVRDADPEPLLAGDSPWLLHVGLYAYRRDYLLELTRLAPSPLEQLERLEQLRPLQHGAAIGVSVAEHSAVGIDTPDDYARFVVRAGDCPEGRAA